MSLPILSVTREHSLFRRIIYYYIKNGRVDSSSAFMKNKKVVPQISVDLTCLTTPQESLSRKTVRLRMGLGELSAAVPLDLGLRVEHEPQPSNCAHANIKDIESKEQCWKMAQATSVIIQPPTERALT